MTNNTEQRRAFEEWLKTVLSPIPEMGYEDEAKDLALLAWQAALAQREQEAPSLYDIPDNELPGMWEKADFEGGKPDVVRGPAPSLCTAEEAAELAQDLELWDAFRWMTEQMSDKELAAILNADRAKRL
jgi:hypothetical protein